MKRAHSLRNSLAAGLPLSRRQVILALWAGATGYAIPARAGDGTVKVWHGKTGAEFEALFKESVRDGYRVRSLCLYGPADSPFYAALMAAPDGRPSLQRCALALEADDMRAEIERQAKQNCGAVALAATGSGAKHVFAAVFEPQERLPLVRLALKSGDEKQHGTFQAMVHEAKLKGLILSCASAYGPPDAPLFATVWSHNADKVAWDADGIMDDERLFAERMAAQRAGWARLAFVTPVGRGRFLSIYRDDQTGPWSARHALSAERLDSETAAHSAQGLQAVSLAASGSDARNARFAAVFTVRDTPVSRQWRATGPIANERIDEAMRTMMTPAMIRHASLAIVKGSRLVYARGYTYGEPDWPVTEPSTAFRLASVSKTIAALAAYQLIEAGKLKLGDSMQEILDLRTMTGAQPTDARFKNITIEHLLNHTSGLPTHRVSSVAIRDAHAAALPDRAWHFPVTAEMAKQYIASLKLVSDPGEKTEYNNCAYFLLGQVIAKLHGTGTALEAMQKNLLAPLGISRIRHARSCRDDQPADEARYRVSYGADRVRILSVGRSVMSDARPLVPIGYGLEHMEIHEGDGGLSGAMTDVARLLAIVIARQDTQVLRGETLLAMLSNAAARKGHGFDEVRRRADGGFYGQKRGALATSWNAIQFDGDFGFAVVWSGGQPDPKTQWYPDLPQVMGIARHARWGDDLFPEFGMASPA